MKKALVAFLVLFTCLFGNIAYAAEKVTVKIPRFNIAINDNNFDNEKALYPFVVYKDITYFPMTYNLCRELGLATGWDNKKGLYITKYTEEYERDVDFSGNNKKGANYIATFPTYPITLNGVKIDNSKEEYPILNFRGTTYFPLIPKFVNDEFDLLLEWDKDTGLKINRNNNEEGFQTHLSDINNEFALLQNYKSIYKEVNADGSVTHTNKIREIKNYRLDFNKNEITFLGMTEENKYFEDTKFESIDKNLKIEGNKILYNEKVLLENLDDECSKDIVFHGDKLSCGKADFLRVSLYYDTYIPAPYTPHDFYVFMEKDGNITQIKSWDKKSLLEKVYETSDGYYLGSYSKNISDRYINHLCTIVKVDKKSMREIILNNLWSNYKSLKIIGVYDDKVYMQAKYFGNTEEIATSGKVNAIKDGYFYMNKDMKLNKIYDFVEGNAFVAPNGILYLISPDKLEVTNLSIGSKVKIIN